MEKKRMAVDGTKAVCARTNSVAAAAAAAAEVHGDG